MPQQGELWEKWRQAGIGSSDAAPIMGVSLYCSRKELYARKKGMLARSVPNAAMERGHRLEAVARELYHQLRGVHTRPVQVIHDDYDWLRASLDGLSDDNTRIVELKAIKAEHHAGALRGRIPEYIYPQLQHQLLVTGLTHLDYWSYSESTKFPLADRVALVEVKPDREYQQRMFEQEREFWEDLTKA